MPKLKYHEAANIFPLMTGPAFDEFVDDIKLHGQHDPIVLCGGKILDGRNRYVACVKLGIEPKSVEDKTVKTLDDAVAYVMAHNLHRRQLTVSQRGMIAAKSIELYRKAAKERMKTGGRKGGKITGQGRAKIRGRPKETPPIKRPASDDAATAAGASGASTKRCLRILRDGTPKLIEAVETGRLVVSAADLLTQYPRDKQREILSGSKAVIQDAVAAAAPPSERSRRRKPGRRKPVKAAVVLVNQIVAEVRRSEHGTEFQRDQVLKQLTTAREWLYNADQYL